MTSTKKQSRLAMVNPVSTVLNYSDYKSKRMYCWLHKKKLRAFQVPTELLKRLSANQARLKDCKVADVLAMEDSMEAVGQDFPICIDRDGAILWGHTRFRASENIFMNAPSDGENAIPDVENDHIWAYVFAGSEEEKIVLQLKENCNKMPHTPASKADVVHNLKKLIKLGKFDDAISGEKFADLPIDNMKSAMKAFVNDEIPVWGARKFRGLWNALRKEIDCIDEKFRTWDKPQMCKYYMAHNPFGITQAMWQQQQIDNGITTPKAVFESGEIFATPNHGNVCIWFMNSISTWLVKSSSHEKRFAGLADMTVLVSAINSGSPETIDGLRENKVAIIQKWNDSLYGQDSDGNPVNTPSIHEVHCVPQTESELDLLDSGEYAKIVKYY